MSLEYKFDYVGGSLGEAGPQVAELATKRGAEGWRLASLVRGAEGWALFFERALPSSTLGALQFDANGALKVAVVAQPDPLSPEQRAALNPDRSVIADAPPLEVPSATSFTERVRRDQERVESSFHDAVEREYQAEVRQQGTRIARLEQIIRRRDEVITLVRDMTKNWTPASKNYIDDDVDAILASLARLDEEEKPRDSG